jgi:hypothetical protein
LSDFDSTERRPANATQRQSWPTAATLLGTQGSTRGVGLRVGLAALLVREPALLRGRLPFTGDPFCPLAAVRSARLTHFLRVLLVKGG